MRVARGERDEVHGTVRAVFAGTHSLQHVLRRMGETAPDAAPEPAEASMTRPNKHHIAFDSAPSGVDAGDRGCVATGEPHGRIERHTGRGVGWI